MTKTLLALYLMLPLIAAVAGIIAVSWSTIPYMLMAIPIVLWIQYFIGHSALLLMGRNYTKRWRFQLRLPWPGYMPDQHISRRVFLTVQQHTSWIGLCLYALVALWTPPLFTLSLVFWHLWLLLPRFYFLVRLSMKYKDGMLKFNAEDVSYYKQ